MNAARSAVTLSVMWLTTASVSAQFVNYEMVTVGDPGNLVNHQPDDTGYAYFEGRVPYEYRIGRYEVTLGQYCAFLNSIGRNDDRFLPRYLYYRWGPSSDNWGISCKASESGLTYAVEGPSGFVPASGVSTANRPMTNISWYQALGFANWMSNGQPSGDPGPTTTDNGAYDFSHIGNYAYATVGRNLVNPNTGAPPTFILPTVDEWSKAAYYSPLLNFGSGGYYKFATQSNARPGNIIGDLPNQANFCIANTYSIEPPPGYEAGPYVATNKLTDVGAFSASASYYGTFDQNGNAAEWTEENWDYGGLAGRGRSRFSCR